MYHRIARVFGAVILSVVVWSAWAEVPTLGIGGTSRPVTVPWAVTVSHATVVGGSTVQCTIHVNEAPKADQVVATEADRPEVFASFPANVVVPAGYTSVTFELATVTVSGSVPTTIYASCNGGQSTGTLTVTP
jgi:hypothetical protein